MDAQSGMSPEYVEFLRQDYDHKVRHVNETSTTIMKYMLVLFAGTASVFAVRIMGNSVSNSAAVWAPILCLLAVGLTAWAWSKSLEISCLEMLFCYLRITGRTTEPSIPDEGQVPDLIESTTLKLLGATLGTRITRLDTPFYLDYLTRTVRQIRWFMRMAFVAYALGVITMVIAMLS